MTLLKMVDITDDEEWEKAGFSSFDEYWDEQYRLKIEGKPHSWRIDRADEDRLAFCFTGNHEMRLIKSATLLPPGVYDFTLKHAYIRDIQGSQGTIHQCFFIISVLDLRYTGVERYLYSCPVSNDGDSQFAKFLYGYHSIFGTSQWRIQDLEGSCGKLEVSATINLDGQLRVLPSSLKLKGRLNEAYLKANN